MKLETNTEELDSRARDVLREIILQHVATGEPISSRSLSRCGRFRMAVAVAAEDGAARLTALCRAD